MPKLLRMSKNCCNFAADLEKRMDLTACNLVKKMLKLVPQDQTVACGFFYNRKICIIYLPVNRCRKDIRIK